MRAQPVAWSPILSTHGGRCPDVGWCLGSATCSRCSRGCARRGPARAVPSPCAHLHCRIRLLADGEARTRQAQTRRALVLTRSARTSTPPGRHTAGNAHHPHRVARRRCGPAGSRTPQPDAPTATHTGQPADDDRSPLQGTAGMGGQVLTEAETDPCRTGQVDFLSAPEISGLLAGALRIRTNSKENNDE